MNRGKRYYYNEAIGLVAILAVMRHAQRMSYAKSMLVIPMVMHKSTVDFLKRKNTKVGSLEELIAKKPGFFSGFKERYTSALPISINSIAILNRLHLIKLEDGELVYVDNNFSFDEKKLGILASESILCSEKISHLLKGDAANAYLQLRVEL